MLNGVLVVDKPQGLTSHDVVAVARRLLKEPRVGHTGTLDPLATGVLVLACGRATRLVRFLSASDKEYEATIRFGLTTDSFDIMGNELTRSDRAPTRDALELGLSSLRGEHLQMPPAHSAKKVGGRRAYDLARRDQPVALSPVLVNASRVELLEYSGRSARVAIRCSAGFYVRSFAQMLGERVGTGACLEALRRTRSGDFDLASAVGIDDLRRDPSSVIARMVPLERLLTDFPSAQLTAEGLERVSHGRDIGEAHVRTEDARLLEDKPAEWVRLLDGTGRLLALGTPGPGRDGGTRSLHPTVVLI